ncbi:MAG: 2-Keto-3-deoxy-D-manno-octulosonate-8-phosphate synthase (EC [uncultured Campylobacterales bacterium]|uniref:3-deoxy-8-phosphooctulonate synthase n=1 Tax=uncultured Campylobacterales bacterium TaxID=352960 RepID=A0A6S6SJX9_9BACT|nr:MAG: 2-Keto-3-deoxy-D-manno-octulosonate-8-phosphate synthase (EC [uncultured Campylobacterales bacterium]
MTILSGPCVIESKEIVYEIASKLQYFQENKDIDFYFKASFDKANRTSLSSFRGPGLEEGLRILEEVKKEFGYKIVTDIHEPSQAKPVGEVVDMIQIPAFLSRQTDLLVAAAKTDAYVNIKKAQFLSGSDMQYSVAKVMNTRGYETITYENAKKAKVFLCERGNIFGYGNFVVDMRNLIIMREFAPVIFDATHSVQMPGGAGGKSGGNKEYVAPLTRAANAIGVDGFFFETHCDPDKALCDGPNMLQVDDLIKLIKEIKGE